MAEHVCDRTIVYIPMVMSGDFPKPNFMMVSNWECQPNLYSQLLISTLYDVPHFVVDRKFVPFNRLEDEEQLKYITNQLEQMIAYVEATFPGVNYDENKLMELQNFNREYLLYERELWKLRAAIPCPLSGKEAFREMYLPSEFPVPEKAVEWARQYVAETTEKVAKGQSALPKGVEERLRFVWSNTGPFHHDPFAWLATKGVSIPTSQMTIYEGWRNGREPIWGDPWHGRKLTPLEEEARPTGFCLGATG